MNHYLFKYAIWKSRIFFIGKKLGRVDSFSYSSVGFVFRDSDYTLCLELSPSNGFIYPFDKTPALIKKDEIPFFSFLRKKIVGCRLIDIKQNFSERVAEFIFEDLRGEIVHRFRFVVEMFDRSPNAILLGDDSTILQAYRYVDSRDIQPGKTYIQPYIDMPDLLKDDLELLISRFEHGDTILGFSSKLRKCIQNKERFVSFVNKVRKAFSENDFSLCSYCKDIYPFCFSDNSKEVDEEYLFYRLVLKPREVRFMNLKSGLIRILKKRLKSLDKKKLKMETELKNAEQFDIYRIYAENLMAHPQLDVSHKDFVEVLDVYTSKPLVIPLNSNFDLFGNAQRYFKKYKKLKNSLRVIKEKIKQAEVDIGFLEQLIFDAENASTYEDLDYVKSIAISEGVIKKHVKHKKKEHYEPYEKISIMGFDAYIGKNAKGNDIVSFKLSSKEDLWFHAKNRPSAHLVLKLPSGLKEVDDSVNIKSAEIVACKTKALKGERIDVDYTKVKNLRKPRGLKTGMVFYSNFKTITVIKNECD